MQILAALYGTPDPLSVLERLEMQQTLGADQARHERMQRALDAYNGNFPDPLRSYPAEVRDSVIVNLIKPIVDTHVHYLFGNPPELEVPSEVDGEDGMDESPEEEWLEECLRRNEWPTFLLDEGINGAVTGTPYYVIDSVLDNKQDAAHPYFRFYAIDPQNMTIRTDERDIAKVNQYEWRYPSVDTTQRPPKPVIDRKLYTLSPDGTQWTIQEQRAYLGGKLALRDADWVDLSEPLVWDYPWPPIGHCKNLPAPNQVYGQADVSDTLIDNNKAINFVLSNLSRMVKHDAHKTHYLVNYNGDPNQLDTSIGSLLVLASDGSGNEPKVGTFPGGLEGLQPSINLKVEIHDSMLEESGTPSIVLGKPDSQGRAAQLSGVALRMRMEPMLQKTETKRKLYGPWLQELIRRLFELGGWGEEILVELTWPELIPVDALAERQALALDMEAGVLSKEGYASRVGIDWEIEYERLQREAEDAMQQQARRMALISQKQQAVMAGVGLPETADSADAQTGGWPAGGVGYKPGIANSKLVDGPDDGSGGA